MQIPKKVTTLISVIILTLLTFQPLLAQLSVPLESISRIGGVRENQLRGYGIVVGLDGTGDGGIDFVNRSIANALEQHGVSVQAPEGERLDNVAAVMVTATLPAFKQSGDKLDITVSSLGDADDLSGGVLIETPMMAPNGEVYAVAQGAVTKGGTGDDLHPTTVTVPDGALVEREVPFEFVGDDGQLQVQLRDGNFTTASRAVAAINEEFAPQTAHAENANTINVQVPAGYTDDVVGFISQVQNLEVEPPRESRIVINERTGTVVMGDNIAVRPVAITHRNISLQIDNDDVEEDGETVMLPEVTTVDQIVDALNAVGASTDDVISILEALNRSGALNAPLEVM